MNTTERNNLGFTDEPGPGVSNRKVERRGKRVVFDGTQYRVVERSPENTVRRGPGRYSGDVFVRPTVQPVPVMRSTQV